MESVQVLIFSREIFKQFLNAYKFQQKSAGFLGNPSTFCEQIRDASIEDATNKASKRLAFDYLVNTLNGVADNGNRHGQGYVPSPAACSLEGGVEQAGLCILEQAAQNRVLHKNIYWTAAKPWQNENRNHC